MDRKIFIMALALLMAFSIVACRDSADPIVGKWSNGLFSVEFKPGGEFIIHGPKADRTGTWKVSGNKLTTVVDGDTETQEYRIEGDTLYVGNSFVTYKRV